MTIYEFMKAKRGPYEGEWGTIIMIHEEYGKRSQASVALVAGRGVITLDYQNLIKP